MNCARYQNGRLHWEKPCDHIRFFFSKTSNRWIFDWFCQNETSFLSFSLEISACARCLSVSLLFENHIHRCRGLCLSCSNLVRLYFTLLNIFLRIFEICLRIRFFKGNFHHHIQFLAQFNCSHFSSFTGCVVNVSLAFFFSLP